METPTIQPSRFADPEASQFAESPASVTATAWHNGIIAAAAEFEPIPTDQVEVRIFKFEGATLITERSVYLLRTLKSGFDGKQRNLPAADFNSFPLLDDFFVDPQNSFAWGLSEASLVKLMSQWAAATHPNGREKQLAARAFTMALALRQGATIPVGAQ